MNGAKERRGNPDCVHHWIIDEFNVGRCKNCPAVRDFGTLQKKETITAVILHLGPGRGKRGRPRKE